MLLITVGVCFLVACLSAFALAHFAPKLKLIAEPGEHRQHKVDTPVVGGLAIYLALVCGCLMLGFPSPELMFCLSLICLMGVLDDRFALPSWSRFIAQGLITYLMIKLTGIQLLSLGVLFSNQELVLAAWSVPVTILRLLA